MEMVVGDWAQVSSEGKTKLHEEVVQKPMVPTPATLPSVTPARTYGALHILVHCLTGDRKTKA